jgi:hypothetical protein
MRLFPKMPNGMGFWQKWNFICVMFTGGCLLAGRFFRNSPEVVSDSEFLVWIGGGALALGLIMQFFLTRK